MGSLSTGGGSSAVAASAHAGCERFRHTDPMVTGLARRELAERLGHADADGGIPEARWMRAMTFERLVKDERFVSPLLTTAVGDLRLRRPDAVTRLDARVSVGATAQALAQAHEAAVEHGHCTLITSLAVPFVGLEGETGATPVKPDFAIVTPRFADDPLGPGAAGPDELDEALQAADANDETMTAVADEAIGSWLVMGDAKDYERVRSRIDDGRMLKGFLQVALGAESAEAWSKRPADMRVHTYGALAVPRNSFLQPTAVMERLDDHRAEVRARAAEREALRQEVHAETGGDHVPESELQAWVDHREKEFDPTSCQTCSMFRYCRHQLRTSSDATDVLVEIGAPTDDRPALAALVTDGVAPERTSTTLTAAVRATLEGAPQFTPHGRIDPVGEAGTIEVVVAKADSSALGVYGMAVRRVLTDGTLSELASFATAEPQAPDTRLAVMSLLGEQLAAAMKELLATAPLDKDGEPDPSPVHLVVPDCATADLLVSIADSLAGIETSRLRWARDLEAGREPLTFDGNPATVPAPLTDEQRLAVSFLLEDDRSRALVGRSTTVVLRDVVARHVIPGGPLGDAGRLDYLLAWATRETPIDHRALSDEIADRHETPGARLSRDRSDELFSQISMRRKRHEQEAVEGSFHVKPPEGPPFPDLVRDELDYKLSLFDDARSVLADLPDAPTRVAHRAHEGAAQEVWRRRLHLHASDLVRFGRTSRWWRNSQVEILSGDAEFVHGLAMLGDPQEARDAALNAGVRHVALARVVGDNPLVLAVGSRRFTAGQNVVALHINDEPTIAEGIPNAKSPTKWGRIPIGALLDLDDVERAALPDEAAPVGYRLFGFEPAKPTKGKEPRELTVGDDIVLGDYEKFGNFSYRREVAVPMPNLDTSSAPRPASRNAEACGPDSYANDPENHAWCCKPHEAAEAEFSDYLAERREAGELNPQVWPPLVDTDAFDIAEGTLPQADDEDVDATQPPSDLTRDDLGE